MLLPLNGDGPLYRRVCDSVRERIRSGRWAGGTRPPGTRTLARDLGVSRIVVLITYEQLAAEGYLVGRRGSGSWAAEQVADPPPHQPAVSEKPRSRRFLS